MSLVERFVVGIDMQRYSTRVARRQAVLQRELDRILTDAAEAAGLSRAAWDRLPAGDGEIALLPPDVDLVAVVRRFVSELDLRLADHNDDHAPETRIRLRVAMHSGVLAPGTLGYVGPALVVLQRLLDSAPVRAALVDVPEANLAQIVSDVVHERAVVPELGGLRPRQFRRVAVDLPTKEFHQNAYLYVPGARPQPPPAPPRLPFPVVTGQPAPRREEPRAEEPAPEPVPEPPPLSPVVRKLVRELRESLERNDIAHADTLTTLAILESAGRSEKGWLRESDGLRISDALLTDVDEAWADFSAGAWGFQAQRKHLDGVRLSGRRQFRTLSVLLGWRRNTEEILPRYPEFTRRADRAAPFYPTLRHPAREAHAAWHDEWLATVMSVHVRLQER